MSAATESKTLEHQDYAGAKIGMWFFILTELILFGGLFLLYAVFRSSHSRDFHNAAYELDTALGAFNTAVLLTSSLTMALAVSAARKGSRTTAGACLTITILFAVAFLVNKYFEWSEKIGHGIYPNSPELQLRDYGEGLFYSLYFTMTGLHGLHVFGGLVALCVVLVFLRRGKITPESPSMIENTGLYWHLVDLVWIFLFPLFYLIT